MPRLRRSGVLLVLLVGTPVVVLAMMSFFSRKPTNLGVIDGRLAECPDSPNCVSTQTSRAESRMDPIPFHGSPEQALQRLKAVLAAMPRTRIIITTDNYLHAECTSLIFRFVDDVEFLVDAGSQTIHFRSASRVGRSDFGINRKRMEGIRRAFEQAEGRA